ncbi:MAG: hypothetical protein M5U28_26815 [Sandaracinaceae bacterium]|nr:hypothetical protein [Sandaracinaceae bacterium]
MARQKQIARGVALPWERRGAWLRELLAGRRWKVVVLLAIALMVLALVWTAAEQRQRERGDASDDRRDQAGDRRVPSGLRAMPVLDLGALAPAAQRGALPARRPGGRLGSRVLRAMPGALRPARGRRGVGRAERLLPDRRQHSMSARGRFVIEHGSIER